MAVKPIHRNLQHQPRIWGVSFFKLFAALFAMLLTMLVVFATWDHGILALAIGAGVGVAGYSLSLYLDRRDPLLQRRQAGFIRDHLSSGSLSGQVVRLRDA